MTAGPADLLATLLSHAHVGVAVLDAGWRFTYVNDRMATMNGRPAIEHLGFTVADVLPELADQILPLLERVRSTGRSLLAENVAGTTAAPGRRAWEASYLPLREGEEDLGVGVVVIDVTDRHRAVAQTRRRLRQQAALADLGQRALREPDLDRLLNDATAMLCDELGAERAGVLEIAPERDHLVMRAGTGFAPGAIGAMTAEIGPGSQAGYTLQSGGLVITGDAAQESRYTFTRQLLDLGVRSAISVPIPGQDAPFGVLGILAIGLHHFDEDDADFVRVAANVLGSAIVRAAQAAELEDLAAQRGRLVAQALDAADRERRQVADTLHDDVIQHLLFARLEIGALDADTAGVQRILASIDEATAVLRGVVGGLHPVTLAHAGLTVALESMAGEYRTRSGLAIDVEVDPDAERRMDRLVLSLVRELLTNVVKHAGAERAAVRVTARDGWLAVDVSDDGCGIAREAIEAAVVGGAVGLANLRERVVALGGSADIGSGPSGRGARVVVRLPSA